MIENVDRRVLGAFRCVDAVLGTPIADGIRVTSPTLVLRKNRSGIFVVFGGPGFRSLTEAFEVKAPLPAASSFVVELEVKGGRHLGRRVEVNLPRKLVPASDLQSVMLPQDVVVFLSPAAPVAPNWAVIRLSLRRADNSERPVPHAVARVTRDSDGALLTTGMADVRGEMLLGVAGLRVSANAVGGGAVMTATIDATITVVCDPSTDELPAGALIDPDLILAKPNDPAFKRATRALKIGSGTSNSLEIPINL